MTTAAFVSGGVEFTPPGRPPLYVPWVAVRSGRSTVKVLEPRAVRGHVWAFDDVEWFAREGRWPPADSIASGGRLWPRDVFDRELRRRDGKGSRPGLTLVQVRDIRTGYWSGDTGLTDYFRCLGIGVSTLKRIVAGRAYWWCGGGSPSWEGLTWTR